MTYSQVSNTLVGESNLQICLMNTFHAQRVFGGYVIATLKPLLLNLQKNFSSSHRKSQITSDLHSQLHSKIQKIQSTSREHTQLYICLENFVSRTLDGNVARSDLPSDTQSNALQHCLSQTR